MLQQLANTVQLFFNWLNTADWRFFLGKFLAHAGSAAALARNANLVRGRRKRAAHLSALAFPAALRALARLFCFGFGRGVVVFLRVCSFHDGPMRCSMLICGRRVVAGRKIDVAPTVPEQLRRPAEPTLIFQLYKQRVEVSLTCYFWSLVIDSITKNFNVEYG